MLSNSYQNWSLFCYFWFCGTKALVSLYYELPWNAGSVEVAAWQSWHLCRVLLRKSFVSCCNLIRPHTQVHTCQQPAKYHNCSEASAIFSYKVTYNTTLKRFQASCNVWISTHQLHLDSRSWHWWKYLEGFSFYILLFGFYNVKFTFSLAFSFFNWYTTSAKIE